MKNVVSVGDLVVDLITPVKLPILPFQHQETRGTHLEPGGGCNFNITARRLGLGVRALGPIGEDMFGWVLRQMLTEEGIQLDGALSMPGSVTCLVYDLIDQTTKEHVFVGSLSDGDPLPFTDAMKQIITTSDAMFVQGYNLHERQLENLLGEVMAYARRKSVPIYCDVGPTVAYIPRPRVLALMKASDYLMMTEDEVPLAADGLQGDAAYRYLFGLGAKALVIKRGGAGCLVVLPEGIYTMDGFQVPVADTVGAGDCFNAGLIYGRVQGWDWQASAFLANAVGAASVQKVGCGRNAPTRQEVESLLQGTGVRL